MEKEPSKPRTKIEEIKAKYTIEEIRQQLQEYKQETIIKKGKPRVLYLDDEEDALTTFRFAYRREFQVFTTSNPDEARKIVKDENLQIILTDQRMPRETGVDFLESIIEKYPDPIRILVTGYSDIKAVIDSINKGRIFRYIQKPYPIEALRQVIQNAAEVYNLRKEKDEMLQTITRANQQLEFLVRQNTLTDE